MTTAATSKPARRPATRSASVGRASVCVCCHRLPKFCRCDVDAEPTCPICARKKSEGHTAECFAFLSSRGFPVDFT